tara:strand:+ start:2017 stop:3840 length:1824 start_codon:yes stop_codon:yes gene_type:complete
MKQYFPSLTNNKEFIFCENAGGSQIPKHVINRLKFFLENYYLQPGNNNILSNNLSRNLEEINNITDIILNNKKGKIIYGNSCSQLSVNLANSLIPILCENKEANLIITDLNHEACVSPFERIFKNNNLNVITQSLNNFNLDYKELIDKVDHNTKLVILPHASNILGNILDIEYLNKKIKEKNKNTKILVDGVAYMPHELIDVDKLDIDYYVVSFYKFCGLRISALYIKDKNLTNITNQNHYFLNDSNEKKLQIGGINFENAISILGIKDYLLDIKNANNFTRKYYEQIIESFKNHEQLLIDKFYKNLEKNNEIKIIESKNLKKIPIFSLQFKNYNSLNISLILNELNILCKSSTFYCDRFFDKYNFDKNEGLLRISLMHYNTLQEVDIITNYLNMFQKRELSIIFQNIYFYNSPDSYLKECFNFIQKDNYYNNSRNRAFSMLKINDNIEIIGNLNFYQSEIYNNFNGNKMREYPNIDENILSDKLFIEILKNFNFIVKEQYGENNKYIQIHKIRVYANKDSTNLVPEGIHQDGYNMIAIYCVARVNIKGGCSIIYDENKKIIYEKELAEGEMIVINDNKYFHNVTNIELLDKEKIGYRDIIVLTTIS